MLISTDQSQRVSQPVTQITLSQFRISQITRSRSYGATNMIAIRTAILHYRQTKTDNTRTEEIEHSKTRATHIQESVA